MITMSKDQVVNVHVTGFPKEWSATQKKEYIHVQTKAEILDVSQYGKKTMFCFKKVDLKMVITSLNNCMVDPEHKIQIQNVTSKSETKNMELAECLHELAAYNWVTPLLDRQQFYLLEKSLRTLYVGNLPQIVTDTDIQNVFNKYGTVEDVSLVLNLETGEHRGFAFVVFQQHEVCDQVYSTAKLLSVNGHLVKIQKSKPSKAVAELAKQAGLYDSEGNVTQLLESLLHAGKQVIMLQQQEQQGGHYVQDASGQVLFVQGQQQQSPLMSNLNQTLPQTIPSLTPTNYVLPNATTTQQQSTSSQNLTHNPTLLQQQMQNQLLQQVLQQQQIGQRLLVQQQLQQQMQQQQQPQFPPQLGQQIPSNPLLHQQQQQHLINQQVAQQQNLLQPALNQQLLQAQYQQLLQAQQQQQQPNQTLQNFPQQMLHNPSSAQQQQQQFLQQQAAFFQNPNTFQNNALHNTLQNPNQHFQHSLQQQNIQNAIQTQQNVQQNHPNQLQNQHLQTSALQNPNLQNGNSQHQQPQQQPKPVQTPPQLNINQMQGQQNSNQASNTTQVPMNTSNGLPPQLTPALPPTSKKMNPMQNPNFLSANPSKTNLSVGGTRKIQLLKLKFAPY